MIRRLCSIAAACLAMWAVPAWAHPHVFVTVKSTVVYGDGAPKEVRHAWRFDEMFSSFATQGLDTNGDGKLDRNELKDLAQVNVTSLKEFDYFTNAKTNQGDVVFKPPVDYWLDYDGSALTLHFTLPVQSAGSGAFHLAIYDPSYFVAFDLAEKDAAMLEGAPAGCRIDAQGPPKDGAAAPAPGQKLGEDFFNNLDSKSGWGEQFANRMTVRCGDEAVAFANQPKAPQEQTTQTSELTQADIAAQPADVLSRVEQAQRIAQDQPLGELPATQLRTASLEPTAAPPAKASSAALGAFGVVRPDSVGAPPNGVFGWIMGVQSKFYQSMSKALIDTKTSNAALFLLAGLSFLYGVFHAAGPGHGKAVISSYLLATGETLRRGVAISFAAAMAQAVTAVAVVGVLAIILGATSQMMGIATWWLEAISYGLIAALGISLLVRNGKRILGLGHVHDENCDHTHIPEPADFAGKFDWRQAGSAVLAIGLRPCTGALLILVFALAQGLIWTGVAATFAMALGTALTVGVIAAIAVGAKSLALRLASGMSGGAGMIAVRGVEMAGGVVVFAFGLMLLGGMLSTGAPVGG
ncbi:DUF1007 family protein [Flaviflagellibacter deserti]|uniref:DUF1007 family protein n=1 Tax=Flaviflagellibacter deserti TaxID=2267266 RepID=A0ABV9YW80_9HYPH